MHTPPPGTRHAAVRRLSLALALACGGVAPTASAATLIANQWLPVLTPQLPPTYFAPVQFQALRLDAAALETGLALAPDEIRPGFIPDTATTLLPLGGSDLTPVALVRTRLLGPELAERYPGIRSYAFRSLDGKQHGHLVVTARGVSATVTGTEGLRRIEPVETADGTVHLSYFDALRTDGANLLEHNFGPGDLEPLPVPGALPGALPASTPAFAAGPVVAAGLAFGGQLRIYRLAASTTGEFFDARDGNAADADTRRENVIASIVADLAGANAVFEPEVGVRLILADASDAVIYDDAATDPFDNSASPCSLRDANRDVLKTELTDDQYDLGFLFATRSGGGASGCAWFVACLTTDDTLHKGRGAGQMGNFGAISASGLLAHEVGHQLGARHTFSGQDGSCTEIEFTAGDSMSAYEPGSGTTRMSYAGICDTDNVDVSVVGAGAYMHSRSFDEIVDNVFNGDGATCGELVETGNAAPVVDAGADFTIPRQTPFVLTGSGSDASPLTYNWEQFDRADSRRAIDTDDGVGPIIRSVPPTEDPARTIPHLPDLLDGVTRKGEILPQVDRDLNFRFIARDNQMGGGGVAYDEMVVHVAGDPFFLIAPDGGTLQAGCSTPLTWQVGGGSVAAQVRARFSTDGGATYPTDLTGAISNDGTDNFVVPCQTGNQSRVRLEAVGNIFFDVSDNDLSVANTPPVVSVEASSGEVDDACEFLVQFSATVTDQCGVSANNVSVGFTPLGNNFTLGVPTVNTVQNGAAQVDVSGSVLISDLTGSPATLDIQVEATDACGAQTTDNAQASAVDTIPPTITASVSPTLLFPPNHKLRVVSANVVANDNCPVVNFALTSATSDEPDNGLGDGDTVGDIQDAALGSADVSVRLRAERAGTGDGRVYTLGYTATDGSGNTADADAAVSVPHSAP